MGRSPVIAVAQAITKDLIPTIDFSILKSGTDDERSRVVRQIGEACAEWGCFLLVNHGVPESLRTAVMDAFDWFLDLPVEDREEYSAKQVLDPIRQGSGLTTTGEGEQYWRDFVRIFVHPTFHSPFKTLHFSRKISEEYSTQTREVGRELLRAIWQSLGLEVTDMEATLDLQFCQQMLVGNRYPPCPQPEDQALGIPSHSDTSLVSILMQKDTISGLQVLHDGKWIPIDPISGSFLIFTGDLLEIVSNGRYTSKLHRVLLNVNSRRLSVVTAIGPPLDNVVIAPAPKLVGIANATAAFRGITYGDFIELDVCYPSEKLDRLRL